MRLNEGDDAIHHLHLPVRIDLNGLTGVPELYQRLQQQLTLPDYCGKNLDALFDVLVADIDVAVTFEWEQWQADIAAAQRYDAATIQSHDAPSTQGDDGRRSTAASFSAPSRVATLRAIKAMLEVLCQARPEMVLIL